MNEIIKFTFSGVPISGSWRPAYDSGGSPATDYHQYNGDAAALATSINSCPGIGGGRSVVSGNFTDGFTVEFVHDLSNTNILPFTAANSTLAIDGSIGVESIQTGSESQNAIHRITISGDTGEFILIMPAVGGMNTAAIAVSGGAAAIASAINTLAALTIVSVTSPSAGVFDVEYIGTRELSPQDTFSIYSESVGTLISITVTVLQHGAPATVSLSGSPLTIAENGGVSVVTAIQDNADWGETTVNLGFGGTAVQDEHYSVSTTSIVMPGMWANGGVGITSGSIEITALDNALSEGDLTIIVEITSITSTYGQTPAENGTQQVTITITDDDATAVSIPAIQAAYQRMRAG